MLDDQEADQSAFQNLSPAASVSATFSLLDDEGDAWQLSPQS
jgi:hypothetical protein